MSVRVARVGSSALGDKVGSAWVENVNCFEFIFRRGMFQLSEDGDTYVIKPIDDGRENPTRTDNELTDYSFIGRLMGKMLLDGSPLHTPSHLLDALTHTHTHNALTHTHAHTHTMHSLSLV